MTTAAVLGWGGDCMNDNATDTGPFIAWRHANGATDLLHPPVPRGWRTKTAELLFCPLMSLHSAHTMPRVTHCEYSWSCSQLRSGGYRHHCNPPQPAACFHAASHRVCGSVSLVWCDQWNVDIKLDNLVDISPSIMQHGTTMLVATHDTGPRRYLVSGFVRDFIWCLWQEILTRRALRLSAVP